MAELAPVAFVLVFVAVVSLPAWLLVRVLRRNRAMRDPAVGQALAQLAAGKGWSYSPRDDQFVERFDSYPFGRSRPARPALDLITGTHRGRPFACFQYAPPRKLPAGENPVGIDYIRVFVVSLPTTVPSMVISDARRSPRWLRRYTVGDDVFDRMFVVGTEEEGFTDRVLTEPLRRWLLDNPPPGSMRFLRSDLIAWQADTKGFDPQRVEPALDFLNDFVDRIPLLDKR